MKAEELRIGDWVTRRKKEIGQVSSIIDGLFVNFGEYHDTISNIKPIPLTGQWLLRFGFHEYNLRYIDITSSQGGGDIRLMLLGNWGVYKIHDDLWSFSYIYFNGQRPDSIAHIKYVHKLQNVYYELEGKELKTAAKV